VVSTSLTAAWQGLERACFRSSRGRLVVVEDPGRRTKATLWTLAHVLWAACDAEELGLDVPVKELAGLIDRHRRGEGFAATPRGTRYFDDNAWLGLVSLRLAEVTGDQAHRERASALVRFVRTGEDPAGGVRWVEGKTTRNTCSTAPGAWLACGAGGPDDRPFAERAMQWLIDVLRRPDGLFADHIDGETIESTVWSYNQGPAVAALRSLGRVEDADITAAAAAETFGADRIWREPPPFLAIWFRSMIEDPRVGARVRTSLRHHVQRMLREARDEAGLFTGGGIGSYDGRGTIDQSAAVQLLAIDEMRGSAEDAD
jgi:predicted alpha-1,6-mannanase (GH76 family)